MLKKFILSDLVALQRGSFIKFLQEGIGEELAKFAPSKDYGYEVGLLSSGYKFKRPFRTPHEAFIDAATFSARLYVNAYIRISPYEEPRIQRVCIAEVPMMTHHGSFVVNGSGRMVVHQIIRSAGIYFKVVLHTRTNGSTFRTYHASIISNRGAWVRMEADREGMIWVQMDKTKKISILVLLRALGLNYKTIFRSLRYPRHISEALFTLCQKARWESNVDLYHLLPRCQNEALKSILEQFAYSPEVDGSLERRLNIAKSILYSRLMDPARYDLGSVGREKMNRKLHLSVDASQHTLCPVDLLAATDYLIAVTYGHAMLDDIDHLQNRRVRSSGELIKNQFGVGLTRLASVLDTRMKHVDTKDDFPAISTLINPKPMGAALREFFGSSPLSQFMDQTNPLAEITHARRLSSLGPGGLNRDHASMVVREIHPSQYGRICPIETPEGKNAGLVGSLALHARVNSDGFIETAFHPVVHGKILPYLVYLVAEQEDLCQVAPPDCVTPDLKFKNTMVPVRYRQEFSTRPVEDVEYVGINVIRMISIATSLIPFLEHDDANRALMGSNMQRQALPLIKPQRPIVGTGFEGVVALDSGALVKSHTLGTVEMVSATQIVIKNQYEDSIPYVLQSYSRSNQDTCKHQRPVVFPGENVGYGDLLADASTTIGGQLSLGQNIRVAYMPWEGYNFEDAILISDRLIYDDLYTSLHIKKYKIETVQTKLGMEWFTRKILNEDKYRLRHLNRSGIAKLGSWVEPGDVLAGKETPTQVRDLTPEARLLFAIFYAKPRNVRDTSLRVPNGVYGRVINIQLFAGSDSNPSSQIFHFYVCQKRRIQVGDKMSGRHGNKGIVSKIVPRQDMPYTQDGIPVDMVLNPLGVPSRMNVGQVYECLLGLAGSYLHRHFRVPAFDEMFGYEVSRGLVFKKLQEARNKTRQSWLFNISHPGKSYVFDGRTGEVFDQPVMIGEAYMLKLTHMVDSKIHARSTGPYSLITQQPLGGRAKGGGQRLGEMEVWALEGFGASYALQEMLTIKSDDMTGRNKAMYAMLQGQPIPLPGTPECFKVLVREIQSLCLDLKIFTSSQTEVDIMG